MRPSLSPLAPLILPLLRPIDRYLPSTNIPSFLSLPCTPHFDRSLGGQPGKKVSNMRPTMITSSMNLPPQIMIYTSRNLPSPLLVIDRIVYRNPLICSQQRTWCDCTNRLQELSLPWPPTHPAEGITSYSTAPPIRSSSMRTPHSTSITGTVLNLSYRSIPSLLP